MCFETGRDGVRPYWPPYDLVGALRNPLRSERVRGVASAHTTKVPGVGVPDYETLMRSGWLRWQTARRERLSLGLLRAMSFGGHEALVTHTGKPATAGTSSESTADSVRTWFDTAVASERE
jgi:hypothetical protein